jgi:hypothetical protein
MQLSRKDLVGLFLSLPLALGTSAEADASPIDPSQTIITLPANIKWQAASGVPPDSIQNAPLFGSSDQPGIYYQLVRWFPGYMSAPHAYDTDRLCVVLSGVWWCNSGRDFDPDRTVPAPAGTFVRRVAHTPHYDGVKADGSAPAVIAICGIGPINYQLIDPSQPRVRRV